MSGRPGGGPASGSPAGGAPAGGGPAAGGPAGGPSGQLSLGDVVAFIQYSRQFTFPIIQVASIVNVLQSAVASAERVFELLDEPEEIPDPVSPAVDRARRGLGRVRGRLVPLRA